MKAVVALLAIASALVLAGAAGAQQIIPSSPRQRSGSAAGGALSAEPISDIMAHQQERHIKLWFAGQGGNWPLANYEIGELGDGFDDVGKMLGGDIVKQHVGAPPRRAAESGVDGKDTAAFAAAYDRLSAGCDACHRTLDHALHRDRAPERIAVQRLQVFPPLK